MTSAPTATTPPTGHTAPLRVGIIVGSTRPGRRADAIASWVHVLASRRHDAVFEVVDLADHPLPHLDEPIPPMAGQYSQAHTQGWAARIRAFDAYVFVTPEYNHAPSGALKNAIDYLFAEWNDKAAGFVSYGANGGVRAVEQLRLILGELKVADVRSAVAVSIYEDFRSHTEFAPGPIHVRNLATMLDELVAWGTALRTVRSATGHQEAA